MMWIPLSTSRCTCTGISGTGRLLERHRVAARGEDSLRAQPLRRRQAGTGSARLVHELPRVLEVARPPRAQQHHVAGPDLGLPRRLQLLAA